MKKLLAIILCVCLSMTSLALFAQAADAPLKVTLVSDTHLSELALTGVTAHNSIDEDYSHVISSGNMLAESRAIFAAFLKEAAGNDSKYLFVCGDITNYGSVAETALAVSMLSEFEAETGKTVFVINGNHDVVGHNSDSFKLAFAGLGYDKAIAIDPDSCSYVAELDESYRLIAIDSAAEGISGDGFNPQRIEWIKAQAAAAKRAGKHLIAITHHNIIEHFPLQTKIFKSSVASLSHGLCDLFADLGIKYVFSGHSHDVDISSYKSEKGNIFYNVIVPALSVYPSGYRTVSFSREVEIKHHKLSAIDTTLLPTGFSGPALSDMQSNWSAYIKKSFKIGIATALNSYLRPASVKNALGVTNETAPEIAAAIDSALPRFVEAIDLPLYIKDANGSESLESLAARYQARIPDSGYKTARDLFCEGAAAFFAGGELGMDSEIGLMVNVLATVLNYALAEVSDTAYAAILSLLVSKLGAERYVTENLINYAASAVRRFDGIEYALAAGLTPLFIEMMGDEAPADYNTSLPGYGYTYNAGYSFIEFIQRIFNKLVQIYYTILAFFKLA